MTLADQVHKLEALLERVRKNRTSAPSHAANVAAPLALELPAARPPAPSMRAAVSAPPVAPSAPAPSPPVFTPAAQPVLATPAPSPVEPPPVATTSWQPEPGSAVQARPVTAPPPSVLPSLPPEEVSDDDLLEVTTIPPEAPAAAAGSAPTTEAGLNPPLPEHDLIEPPLLDAPFVESTIVEPPVLEPDATEVSAVQPVSEEQAPISSRRFKEPEEASLGNAPSLDGEREIPIKTPPPESGPQAALPPGLEAARAPAVDELEADLISPPSRGPTTEQLGETIELEEAAGPELEIDVTIEEEAPISLELGAPEELEVALPRPSLQSGLYDLTSPPPPAYPEPVLEATPPS
ncbi:MAG TPA: hypothetical protein VGQ57_09220, partial [Polyangiaceae bacterium]|nr:hypothetical protein [Polyangiaceae bacterium]